MRATSVFKTFHLRSSRIQEFRNSGIPEFRILELPKWAILKAYSACHVFLQNGTFEEFKNSRIQEFKNPEFRNSGTPRMGHFESPLCVPLLHLKLSIWGVQDWSKASRFDHGLPHGPVCEKSWCTGHCLLRLGLRPLCSKHWCTGQR